jgi:hypothetical protein
MRVIALFNRPIAAAVSPEKADGGRFDPVSGHHLFKISAKHYKGHAKQGTQLSGN